ncbi:YndJ family protein [Alkalicoccus daliensis]|uniref:YndJ-like protein n=1 Tax=Alkalicoccus daliensis TaxID=745820 RepID=A0A1H0I047_9BACI|nr:YndJ family protein [Alkalicoccus daliensis]SDO24754.1 YndJ-like protein [Alkalicoccus daliensis]
MTAKKNVAAGVAAGVLWLIFTDINVVQAALALSFLVLIPLLLHIAVPKRPDLQVESLLTWLSKRSFLAGIFGLISISFNHTFVSVSSALVWFLFMLAVAACGAWRIQKRGLYPAEETIIDTGLIFTGAGGLWLVLWQGGIDRLLPYDELTMSLTAVHYHYSAVVIPILTGAFGRLLISIRGYTGPPYRFLAIGAAIGSPLIALGVVQGPPLELVYVFIYAVLLYWLSIWWLCMLPKISLRSKLCLSLASISLMISMGVTFLYALGVTLGEPIISYEKMFYWHGAVNAIGFSLFGTLGWYLLGSLPKRKRTGAKVITPKEVP